jgi:hypothetical protein
MYAFDSAGPTDKTFPPVPVDRVTPVPPWATDRVPTMFETVIFPEMFDALMLHAVTVPMNVGLDNVGVDDRTLKPVPVVATAPVPPRVVGRATVSVAALATVPTILIAGIEFKPVVVPVPPRLVGSTPVMVAAVATVPTMLAAEILVIPDPFPDKFDATIEFALTVPIKVGFDNVGTEERTIFPVPVELVTPVPPCMTPRVPTIFVVFIAVIAEPSPANVVATSAPLTVAPLFDIDNVDVCVMSCPIKIN